MSAFIETQFPIARLSAESYKERKAGASQTLTGLGKWWGRKPLILVRASILGMLMPASDNPKMDRAIFLKILTMDDDGTVQRWKSSDRFSVSELEQLLTVSEREKWNSLKERLKSAREKDGTQRLATKALAKSDSVAKGNARIKAAAATQELEDISTALRAFTEELQIRAFNRLPYPKRIARCERPENITGPTVTAWTAINAHLQTSAACLADLVEQLSQLTFGHTARVGDCFCGGGSIPFEAARIGCEVFGSDLNPAAGLLSWASLNLLGGGKEVQAEVRLAQEQVFAAANEQITQWRIEHNDRGERSEAFLYCVEVKPEGCEYYIPLAPSWVISEKYRVVVAWKKAIGSDRLQPDVISVSETELGLYKEKKGATVTDSRVIDPFDPNRSWSVEALRGAEGLRHWTNDDVVPRPSDVFQERLYCIRWIDAEGGRRYAAPDAADHARENKVLELLRDRFLEWQHEGFIPSRVIPEGGVKTDEPIRNRGWTHWHHLFTPRQLLAHGLLAQGVSKASNKPIVAARALSIGSCSNWNSKLCQWTPQLARSGGIGAFAQTFYNQALNPLFNWGTRPLIGVHDFYAFKGLDTVAFPHRGVIDVVDARDLNETCDLWITDPPYADAVNYHELGDFFLAWYDKQLVKSFPKWSMDARAELAVRGDGEDFRRAMVEIYKNLACHMPINGLQMVMFTHQDPAVWADLGMILWAAGLKVTAAWTISTETEAVGIKKGNYVQGTVCLVLRRRAAHEPGFLDEVYPLVEDEVKRQIESMLALDEDGEPNFNDADYQLAAYAAALKVLTQYGTLDGKDVEHEVFAVRTKNEKSDFEVVIERALGIACDTLIPRGLNNSWRDLSLVERYYLRALDIESRGERRKGMYEELARGFGVTEIRPLLKSDKANGTRMFTPTGLAASLLAPINGIQSDVAGLPGNRARGRAGAPHPFAASPLRHLMFAIRETTAADNSPEPGRQYLRDTFGQGYWGKREAFVSLLEWFAALGNAEGTHEWIKDSEASRILAGRLRNDHA